MCELVLSQVSAPYSRVLVKDLNIFNFVCTMLFLDGQILFNILSTCPAYYSLLPILFGQNVLHIILKHVLINTWILLYMWVGCLSGFRSIQQNTLHILDFVYGVG